jgi:hypothetical protein
MYSGTIIDDLLNTVERAEEHARLEAAVTAKKAAVDTSMTFIYEFRPRPYSALLGVA